MHILILLGNPMSDGHGTRLRESGKVASAQRVLSPDGHDNLRRRS